MSRRATAPGKQQPSSLMRDDRLLLACLGLFALFFVGKIAGAATYN